MNFRLVYSLLPFALFLFLGCDQKSANISISSKTSSLREGEPLPDRAGDWPWWRGPTHDGIAEVQDVPRHWGEKNNVLWKVSIPGKGHASPVVVEDLVFIPTADDEKETMSLLCLDRDSGEVRWNQQVHQGGFMHTHKKNSHA